MEIYYSQLNRCKKWDYDHQIVFGLCWIESNFNKGEWPGSYNEVIAYE